MVHGEQWLLLILLHSDTNTQTEHVVCILFCFCFHCTHFRCDMIFGVVNKPFDIWCVYKGNFIVEREARRQQVLLSMRTKSIACRHLKDASQIASLLNHHSKTKYQSNYAKSKCPFFHCVHLIHSIRLWNLFVIFVYSSLKAKRNSFVEWKKSNSRRLWKNSASETNRHLGYVRWNVLTLSIPITKFIRLIVRIESVYLNISKGSKYCIPFKIDIFRSEIRSKCK